MKRYFDILMVANIFVFGIDIARFWDVVSATVKGWLTHGAMHTPFQLKPFSCSLCMTFWTGLLYLAIVGALSVGNVAYVCFVAMLTPRIKDCLLAVDSILAKFINKII